MLAGHADRSGPADYNVGLSQRRADSVKGYMTSHAIPEGVISTDAFGESRPRVDTADGVREGQNRRVEITDGRSDEGRGGKECVSTCIYRRSPYHQKNTKN